MVDQSLVDYIRNGLRDGISIDFLIQQSLNQGWTEQEIKEAANIAAGRPVSTAPHVSEPPTPGVHTTRLPRQTPSTPQARPAEQTQQAQPAKSQTPQEQKTRPTRPTGITIICVFGIIYSVFSLLFAIAAVVFVGLFAGLDLGLGDQTVLDTPLLIPTEQVVFLVNLMAYLSIVISIIYIVGFYLLLKMKRIGWIIITIMGMIAIILDVLSLSITNIPSIAVVAIILIYLFTKRKLFV
jgi:hypothetical protein